MVHSLICLSVCKIRVNKYFPCIFVFRSQVICLLDLYICEKQIGFFCSKSVLPVTSLCNSLSSESSSNWEKCYFLQHAFVATGTNLSLQFFPASWQGEQRQTPTREYVDFEREAGKQEDALAQQAFEEARRRTREFEDRDRSHREEMEARRQQDPSPGSNLGSGDDLKLR
ncbi:core-binding factor subunit beta isoform X5 [Malaclemys terrapin pileata]|uniref:core-binding factor subunit beta isoform X5 n=1 Tax=Malaclemys terrapin pileata TaxID=2991368 RepID=UPI0023A88622|nr:core-binding factor subunit beta isoform X5 [Malaclemys terrapin pileata]